MDLRLYKGGKLTLGFSFSIKFELVWPRFRVDLTDSQVCCILKGDIFVDVILIKYYKTEYIIE